MEYKIIEGTDDHIDEVVELWTTMMKIHQKFDVGYFSDAASKESFYFLQMEEFISGSSKTLFVLEIDGKVCGYVTAMITYRSIFYNSIRCCSIEDIMIDQAFRRKGFGKLLVSHAMDWGREYKVERFCLNVFEGNTTSLAFFQSLGFRDRLHTLELACEK
jgi:diamine N-acetyltransferase